MTLRQKLACVGLTVFGLQIASAAAGGAPLADRLRLWLDPEQLLAASVRMELGAPPVDVSPTPEAAAALSASTPAPEATPTPTADDDTAEDAPTTTADGLPIVATSIAGGLSIKNETDIAVDAAALLQQGPAVTLPAGEPQILIMHTHASEAFTPAGRDLYPASDTCRTEDTNYNIVHVGDVLADTLGAAGLQVLHDRTIYDYPSYTGSYNRSGAAVQAYLSQYPSLRIVIDLHRDALCSDSVVYKTVAELPDAACSQVMLLVGTNASGLYHPYWEENLRLAVYLQDAVNTAHPTLMRPITLVNERYNQHLTRGSLIIEVGSSGNTLQEAIRAVRLFGESAGPALAGSCSDRARHGATYYNRYKTAPGGRESPQTELPAKGGVFMQVRNYMTGAAAVTHPDEPVVAAARLMRMRGIGALPVCEDDGTLAGMLTDRDIVVRCVSSGGDPGAVTVRSIMSRDPVTVEAGADIRRAMETMRTAQVRRLP